MIIKHIESLSDNDFENDGPYCDICGSSMDFEPCDMCGGDGVIEVYESDPLWYDIGDTETCHQCGGEGGWWVCFNVKSHPD